MASRAATFGETERVDYQDFESAFQRTAQAFDYVWSVDPPEKPGWTLGLRAVSRELVELEEDDERTNQLWGYWRSNGWQLSLYADAGEWAPPVEALRRIFRSELARIAAERLDVRRREWAASVSD